MESLRDQFSTELSSGCNSNVSLFQKRSSSELVRRQLYKTKMCAFYNVGKCTRGNLCAFAHSVQELRPLPDLRFTRLCELTKRGDVCRDINCTFAHSLNDLRTTEIPPTPLNEINILKATDHPTIKRINSSNELKCKFRNSSSKDSFLNKSEEDDIFISSTDTTPHNLSLNLRDSGCEGICQWRKFESFNHKNVKNNHSGIFYYLDTPESSHLDNNWAYEDFNVSFSSELSGISQEAPCKFIGQGEFQDPPNYFSSKCHLTKGVHEWGLTDNRDKLPSFQYDILNIFGNESNNKYQRDISSIEKGTLHIIN
ncbi:asparagine-rich protein [Cryptosporidium ryanae]|uniref:asparagine-rich protein n=1 Tax=Cryptosporidium ryanae TaxID=515981 RepID=UPI00351A328E|nr:asparagine-rich protein [Cryptosporidium ryanae]